MFSSGETRRAVPRAGRFTGLVVILLLWGAATAPGAETSSNQQRYIFFDLTTPESENIDNRVFIAVSECGDHTEWMTGFIEAAEAAAKAAHDNQGNLAAAKRDLSDARKKLSEAQTAVAEMKVELAAAEQEAAAADSKLKAVEELMKSEECDGPNEPLCREELIAASLRVSESRLRLNAARPELAKRTRAATSGQIEKAVEQAESKLGEVNKSAFKSAQELYADLSTNRKVLARCSDQRWVTGGAETNTAIAIVFFDAGGNQPKISFEEEDRKSQIGKDISSMMALLTAAGVLKARDKQEPTVHLTSREYVLTRTRATLTVKASLEYDKDGTEETLEQQAVVLTGPKEHWFLSVDFPVTDVETLKFNSDAGRLEPTDTSSTYVGASYMFGDLVAENRGGFVLKALLSLSSDPLDSYGLGLGYRFRARKAGGFDFRAFSPFAGVTWTREDEVLDDGTTSRGSERSVDFVAGISFNIDVGLGMLK